MDVDNVVGITGAGRQPATRLMHPTTVKGETMVLVRQEIGDVLRDTRLRQGRTLRQVASRASVALGYLSEVERGQKEASSEILASVADALEVPLSSILREVGDRLAVLEGLGYGDLDPLASPVPDTLPAELVAEFDSAVH
ncbi:Helix-turn-helix domain-containing protein [Agrococcus carbonis]|uniref:Helix-turn-helix domain-containing protein n=2 Tax=Agrococcus carbonis TaxID=684552 RepID=A0A1H1SIP2_9MICO|nr:Helix-turn-helix domain-containing protein [Agrococcus carbonis]